ncbi:Fic/DOC family protein [Ideonella sp.]|uniref:Fic/DOC family protein n=1 Tax=Ideonella sp. TaxID=1929293 RepID=UPI003BB8028F
MFDPFGDYADAGYLRNHIGEKDLELVKVAEHELFRAQLPRALSYLVSCKRIGYHDFLEVHRILFDGLYPWAGQDRAQVLPERAVIKGEVYFCHPRDCQRAVNEGLSLAQDKKLIATRPGFVMGMFAYGHPFLDGNGRTMLLIHAELCFRAGLSVDWTRTGKGPYLEALTLEIQDPNAGHLDAYLRPFIGAPISRDQWAQSVATMPGLDGTNDLQDTAAQYEDPDVTKRYQAFERRRGYKLDK